MAVAETGFAAMDCADPLALGESWAAMLGGEIAFASPRPSASGPTGSG